MTNLPIKKSSAVAPANSALIKYWGKRDARLNLPLADSLSVTMSNLKTAATVAPLPIGATQDLIEAPGSPQKSIRVLERIREQVGIETFFRVRTDSNIPPGAGLAGSAAAAASIALAASYSFENRLDPKLTADAARCGSGSAIRSLFPGYVRWRAGVEADGSDCLAESVAAPDALPLCMLSVIIDRNHKTIGSTEAMGLSASSPLFEKFIRNSQNDIELLVEAINSGRLPQVAEIAERSTNGLHDLLAAADPPINYLTDLTRMLRKTVLVLRKEGIFAFYSIDAGPNLVVFTTEDNSEIVAEKILAIDSSITIETDYPGAGAAVVDRHLF